MLFRKVHWVHRVPYGRGTLAEYADEVLRHPSWWHHHHNNSRGSNKRLTSTPTNIAIEALVCPLHISVQQEKNNIHFHHRSFKVEVLIRRVAKLLIGIYNNNKGFKCSYLECNRPNLWLLTGLTRKPDLCTNVGIRSEQIRFSTVGTLAFLYSLTQ